MDSTRISLARILEADVPLTWQEAVAVVQEVAMVSDVEAALTGSPPLVTSATCFLTAAGDIDLPETAANETPGAVADLLQTVLRGREVPAALLALAQRRPDDLFGELAAFSSGPRRPVIAALAARALSPALVTGGPIDPPRRPTPAAPTPPTESGPRRWAPMVPTGAASPPTVVDLPTPPAGAPSPTPPVAAAPPPAAAVPPPPQRAPEPAAAPVAPASTLASTPPRPRPPAPVPVVPAGGLTPQGVVAAELQLLRLKTAHAGARRRFTPTRRAGWIAGGTLAAGVLAALLWAARSDTPAPLEAKNPGVRAMWPFAASVAPVSPVAFSTRPAQSDTTSPRLPPRQDMSIAAGNVLSPMTTASPLEPNVGANGVEAPPRARMSSGGVVPAPSGQPRDAPRVDLASTAPATAPPTAVPPPAKDAPSLVPSTTTARRATAMSAGRGRALSREIFSAGDADVAPAELRRQQLPTAVLEPGTLVPEGWPFLTLVVDETGVVESVRLTASTPAPGQSLYRHRMLVAAAKAWQFEPAIRDGQPVRYEIRVPLEP